jgi:pyruvate formate lyase activating enzyme
MTDLPGTIFDIDTFAIHDGPGIRMAVYFKGCSLRCAWCHSPESQRPAPELIFIQDRCQRCGACAQACPQGVHEVSAEGHALRRERCLACGRCVAICAHHALAIKGYEVSASEIVARAERLKPFFAHSGGGVTLTGGEVTMQPGFAAAILKGCRERGIHTAIETSGACAWASLARLLPHTDLLLYDIKLVDEAAHRKWIKHPNKRILQNAARAAEHRNVVVRVPLIPGITDTDESLCRVVAFMSSVGLRRVELLPYNPSAGAKYEWLGRPYPIQGEPQGKEQIERLERLAHLNGVQVQRGRGAADGRT